MFFFSNLHDSETLGRGQPLASHFTTEANKEDMNERQTGCWITSEVNCITTTPNPEIATDYSKQDLIFVGTNLVVRVIMIVIIETPGKTKKSSKTSQTVSVLTVGPLHLLRHTSQSMLPGKRNACYGRCFWNSFVLWFLHLWVHLCIWQVRFWCWKKPLNNTTWFWAFCWWTHKAGGITIGSFQKVWVGSIVLVGFYGMTSGMFFFEPTSSLRC